MFAAQLEADSDVRARKEQDYAALFASLSPLRDAKQSFRHRIADANATGFAISSSHHEQGDFGPFVCAKTNRVVCFWGRIDNRADLDALLNTDAQMLGAVCLAAWDKWQSGFGAKLLGDFSIAILEPDDNRVILARDTFGAKPLYYHLSEHGCDVATTPMALLNLAGRSFTKSKQWIAHYLFDSFYVLDHETTAYEGLMKLPAGHVMVTQAGQVLEKVSFVAWDKTSPKAKKRDPKWVARHRKAVDTAVAHRLDSQNPMAAENSGGLDSASVICLLAKSIPNPGKDMSCFGTIWSSYEEDMMQSVVDAAGIANAHISTFHDADIIATTRDELAILGFPASYPPEIPYPSLRLAADTYHAKTIFTGFGGDEVATNYGEERAMELVDDWHFKELWSITPGHWAKRPFRFLYTIFAKGRSAVLKRKRKLSDDYETQSTLLHADAIREYGLIERSRAFSAERAEPRSINDKIVDVTLKEPFIPQRLEENSIFGNAYGLEYRWPLLDVGIVQNFLATPSIEKVGPRRIWRYLHRRAMQGVLPTNTIWRNTKNMGQLALKREERDAMAAQINQIAQDLLDNLHPDLAPLVDHEKLQHQLDASRARLSGPPSEEDSFYWERVTNLYRLNLWLERGH